MTKKGPRIVVMQSLKPFEAFEKKTDGNILGSALTGVDFPAESVGALGAAAQCLQLPGQLWNVSCNLVLCRKE